MKYKHHRVTKDTFTCILTAHELYWAIYRYLQTEYPDTTFHLPGHPRHLDVFIEGEQFKMADDAENVVVLWKQTELESVPEQAPITDD